MGILFGKSKSRITDQDRAVLQLKQCRDKIKQYQRKIELNLEKDRNIAKKLLADGKKERALLLLRKKRYQEQLLQKTDIQLENLERLTTDLEFTQVEQQVLNGLKLGNEALKKLHQVMSIDEIERIMDETRDGVDKQKEIDDIITGALTADDEEAVETEYESMIADLLPNVPETQAAGEPDLPQVPDDELSEEGTEKKKEKIKKKERVAEMAS